MVSIRNLGGSGGTKLKMEVLGMYYDTGSTNGVPLDMQRIYRYYNFIKEPKSFYCTDDFQAITVNPETRDWPTS